MKFGEDIGPIHFIGIGGIGMSGIAEALNHLGYKVQGSDMVCNTNVERLQKKGIPVMIGHRKENIENARVVVMSSAIQSENPELATARERLLPIVRRAEMLAELMRFRQTIAIGGTHGKTTTTSMVGTLLDAGNLDPTIINGGIVNAYGTNARLGNGDWMVVEADESDGTFIKLPADIAVVTNIDPEHMDHYGNYDALRRAFLQFVSNVPFYGFAVMNIDHDAVQSLIGDIHDRHIITFGVNPQADYRIVDRVIRDGKEHFSLLIRERRTNSERRIDNLVLPMPGEHNVSNATAAITVALNIGVGEENVRKGLANFAGVKRRFTFTGEWQGVAIYDDYGHHPIEIVAVLKAARSATKGKIIAIMQPHRYSRLRDLFDDFCRSFNDADSVLITDVYEAGETPIEGVNKDSLVEGIRQCGHRQVMALNDPVTLPKIISQIVQPGDSVIFLGAGNITQWANSLPDDLKALEND